MQLAGDADAQLRAKAAYLLGVHATPASNDTLLALLDDPDASVRRIACESLVRARRNVPIEQLFKLLAEPHPFVAWAGRRALEQAPRQQWQSAALSAGNVRVFVHGAVALATLGADRDTASAILAGVGGWLKRNPTDDDKVDLLRVAELALMAGSFKGDELPELRIQISALFPVHDYRLNRELLRVLVMMQDPSLAPRLVQHLYGKAPMEERIQAAMLARFLQVGWTAELRSELLGFFNLARQLEGGNSYKGYLTNGANDIVKNMPTAEQTAAIQSGSKDPAFALPVVEHLPATISREQAEALVKLDQQLAADKRPEARDLARAILLALGRADDQSAAYLRQVFEAAPDRRQDVAHALAAGKTRRADDWPILVRSLNVVEGSSARDVLRALAATPNKDDKPQDLRQVILLGLKFRDQGSREAALLLQHWTGQKPAEPNSPDALAAWQKWFVERYPDQPEPVLPVEAADNRWSFASLVEFLSSDDGSQGDVERGAVVFEKAQCVKCHRYGTRGEGIGPDLSNVSSRFQRKEIVESVIFPSQVISDQFAAKTVVTTDGRTFTGLVGPTSEGVVVLQPNAEKVNVAKADIDMIVPSKKSAMPEGLFNTLSPQEIADLFAYLGKPPAAK